MADAKQDSSIYYVPENGWYPPVLAFGIMLMLTGLATFLNADAGDGTWTQSVLGLATVIVVLFFWYAKVIEENMEGLPNEMLRRSYVIGMAWFIFSEVMFFAAFFGALFYVRTFAVDWLGGVGDKGMTGDYLWPEFESTWPVESNPDSSKFVNPGDTMAPPAIGSAWLSYLPFWNTVVLLTSSVTVHMAHSALKVANRKAFIVWLGVTVALAVIFLWLQGLEYVHAYNDLGLTLGSGIYGSTFFLLTGFHGFHVTLGTIILLVQLLRAMKGHFTHHDCFGFEAASWYWHFVDVVWLGLFLVVYLF